MSWSILLAALIAVESGGDPNAIGDGGRAVGLLQIHPCVVEDCNRILESRRDSHRYTLADRRCPAASRAMAVLYLRHYGGLDSSYESYARIWNGGPAGNRKQSTVKYWKKVQKHLQSQDTVLQ